MRFPSAITEANPVWEEQRQAGYHSAFRFPFHGKVTPEQRRALADQLLTLPMTSVLFLKHLEEVVIEVDALDHASSRQWLLERHGVTETGVVRCGGLSDSGLYRVDLVNRDGDGDRYWVAHNADVAISRRPQQPHWAGLGRSEYLRGLGGRA